MEIKIVGGTTCVNKGPVIVQLIDCPKESVPEFELLDQTASGDVQYTDLGLDKWAVQLPGAGSFRLKVTCCG